MNFSAQRENRKKQIGKFSFLKFKKWCYQNNYQNIYDNWLKNKCCLFLKPSIDRIDPRKGYFLKNMRVTTQKENSDKGYKLDMHIVKGKRVVQFDKDMNYIQVHLSAVSAEEKGIAFEENIRKVIQGKRNHAGGYKWNLLSKCDENIKKKGLQDIEKIINSFIADIIKK